ncbi:MAG: glycosyltransferase family 87 protein [Chloroflexota bacterium]
MTRNSSILIITLLVLGFGLFGLLVWGNYRYTTQNPGGNDFLVHWMGAKSFFEEGISPYSDEVAIRIQTMVYGRPAQAGEHELRVAYPLYSIFLFLPFALIPDYNFARAVWMAVLESGLIIMAFLSLRLVRWRPKPVVLALFLLFSVFWYHALRPVILGNVVILIGLAIVAILLAIRAGHDELAGILMGLITIKPQVVLLLIVFICLWAASNRRWKIVIWFLISLGFLTGVGIILIPDWIIQNLREVIRYPSYNPPGTLPAALDAILPQGGDRLGRVISGAVALMLLIEWFLNRKSEFRGFVWTVCLTLTGSFWIGLQTDPGNFIVAYPALVLTFAIWVERWQNRGVVVSIVAMFLLFIGIWEIFLSTVEMDYQPIQSPVMFLPLPIILLIFLYWNRWWAVRPPRVWFDLLSQSGTK